MSRPVSASKSPVSASILAGGRSSRMGRNKARLRLGRKSMLRHIHDIVEGLGLPCRVIARDRIPKCGPLSGIFTALTTSSAKSELFLACDMPFITAQMLKQLIRRSSHGSKAVFSKTGEGVGFPFLLPVSCLSVVENQIARGNLSLQQLARASKARTLCFPATRQSINVNTPEDFAAAKNLLQETSRPARKPKNRARPACKSPSSG